MSEQKKSATVKIELTDDQKKKIVEQSGQQIESVTFEVTQLEDRVAPMRVIDV